MSHTPGRPGSIVAASAISIIASVIGCTKTPIPSYVNPDLPESQTAVLRTVPFGPGITRIDGAKPRDGFWTKTVRLSAEPHDLTVAWDINNGQTTTHYEVAFRTQLTPGHKYKLFLAGMMRLAIEDETIGQRYFPMSSTPSLPHDYVPGSGHRVGTWQPASSPPTPPPR